MYPHKIEVHMQHDSEEGIVIAEAVLVIEHGDTNIRVYTESPHSRMGKEGEHFAIRHANAWGTSTHHDLTADDVAQALKVPVEIVNKIDEINTLFVCNHVSV